MNQITPTDHFVLTVWHFVWALLVGGGGFVAWFGWYLNKKKKMASPDHPHQVIHKKLDDHIEDDHRIEREIKGHLDKQYDLLITVSSDIGKIKGKMNIL